MAWLLSFSEHPKSPNFKHPLDVRNILAPGIQLKYNVQGVQQQGIATLMNDRGFKKSLTHFHNNIKQYFYVFWYAGRVILIKSEMTIN